MTSISQESTLRPLRLWLGIGGLLSVITGILVLVWPDKTAAVITMVLAFYAIVGGILYLGAGLFGSLSGWARVGHVLAALVFIAAGVVAFMNPGTSAALLAAIVVGFIAAAWIFEGIAALATLSVAPSKGWSVFYAVISILGGIALLTAPLFAATILFLWVGATLVVMGIVEIIRAFSLGRS